MVRKLFCLFLLLYLFCPNPVLAGLSAFVSCNYTQIGNLYSYDYTFTNLSTSESIQTLGILLTTDQVKGISSFYDPYKTNHWEGNLLPLEFGREKYFVVIWASEGGGLLPGQSYGGFSFISENPKGNATWVASSVLYPTKIDFGTFNYGDVIGPMDYKAPNILNVRYHNITGSTVKISWTTDERANSQIEYGFTTDLGFFSPIDEDLTTSHRILLKQLFSSTDYCFRVISIDPFGNKAFSEIVSFRTLEGDGIANINIELIKVGWEMLRFLPDGPIGLMVKLTFNNSGDGDALDINLFDVTATNSVTPALPEQDMGIPIQNCTSLAAGTKYIPFNLYYLVPDGVKEFVTSISGNYKDNQDNVHDILTEFLIKVPPISGQDTIPPEISLSVSPDNLWPPTHKMVLIIPTITVTDDCDPNPTVEMTYITANEGDETNTYDPEFDNTQGDGNTINDIQVDENGNIYLRSERSGTGSGRIYTITYTATDASGNSSTAKATVTVPHDQK